MIVFKCLTIPKHIFKIIKEEKIPIVKICDGIICIHRVLLLCKMFKCMYIFQFTPLGIFVHEIIFLNTKFCPL